ncbi:MAG: roadblock/LC7 domain-containing protein [candidate division WOR-3 bacterium]
MKEETALFEKEFYEITNILKKLLETSNSKTVLLIDKAGQLICSTGDTRDLDLLSFSTLSAADFAATAQLAELIGEKEFSSLFHQGEKESLYISMVANRVILAVLFDQRTTLGLVRVRVKHATNELEGVFRRIFEKIEKPVKEEAKIFDEDFTKEAEEEIDKLFG